jgi:ABC-2 type transport system permease protein
MNKVFWVAWREFSATVFTKGFLLGIVMTPVMIAIVGGAIVLMKNQKGPQIKGSVAVIDRTGLLRDRITQKFTDAADQAEAEATAKQVQEQAEEAVKKMGVDPKQMGQAPAIQPGMLPTMNAQLSLEFLPGDADAEKEKEPLKTAEIKRAHKGSGDVVTSRIALVVVPKEAVQKAAGGTFAPFETFYADRLDFEIQQRVKRRVGESIVDARLATDPRLEKAGLTPEEVRQLVATPQAESKTVTKEGEKKNFGELQMLVPMAFMILLMVSVFTSGQYLLTSTVEEKGNRVMEILLSAVSPMQLMTGKILGYMGVGTLIVLLYGSLGIVGMIAAAMTNLISPMQLVYFVIFFGIAYFLVASMMAAIGAAVNDMREAQTLMTPVMVLLMIPWMTWFLIQRAPNSPLATILSFIPGPNPFVMVIRLAGSEPVPTWQIPVAIAIGIASVIFAAWAAGKIFRIGALMYGKPPNFKTLLKWVRMA